MILQKSQTRKKKKNPAGIFSRISILGLAQKRLILIEWITYRNVEDDSGGVGN